MKMGDMSLEGGWLEFGVGGFREESIWSLGV